MAKAENLLTVKQFADKKLVNRSAIYTLIKDGKIVPVTFLERQCVDWEVYGSMDIEAALKEKGDAVERLAIENRKIKADIVDLKDQVAKMKHVVYQTSAKRQKAGKGHR